MLYYHQGIGLQHSLIITNDCPCPGHNITFECTNIGVGTTVWSGTAGLFDCPNYSDEILLRHINFDSSVTGECNAGAILGQSLRVEGNSYTSQLSVVYREDLAGRNVTCSHDNGFTITSRLSLMIIHNMIGNYHICAVAEY